MADGQVRLATPTPPPPELLARLREHKAEIAALLRGDSPEPDPAELEERRGMAWNAAPERYLDAWARLQCQKPVLVSDAEWRQAIDDADRFLDQWGRPGPGVPHPGTCGEDIETGSWPMSAFASVTGTLHRDPVTRTAKTGKDFVTALMRSESQGETLWVNAVAFDEAAQAELRRLKAGEALTIQGAIKVGVYEKNGEHRASLDVIASNVLAL